MDNIIQLVRNDITNLDVECIVNAANSSLRGGGGVDGAIHRAAGRGLLRECISLGGCNVGEAKITGGYNLPCKYVIHTVGPKYGRELNVENKLRSCYINTLNLAKSKGIHEIAFPSISTGIYRYPLNEAVNIAVNSIEEWMNDNVKYGMDVIICCFDDETYNAYASVLSKE